MKREFYEISDDEWENHNNSFKPSRVLKAPRVSSSPPPIESFAYGSRNPEVSDNDTDDDDDCVEITPNSAGFRQNNLDELEDEDVDNPAAAPVPNRGRRFIIDDDDDDVSDREVAEMYDIESTEEEEEEDVKKGKDEGDVVGRALHKCAKISTELKKELFGSSRTACERYSEVESSSVKIVTQVLQKTTDFVLFCFVVKFFEPK